VVGSEALELEVASVVAGVEAAIADSCIAMLETSRMPSATMLPFAPLALKTTVTLPADTVKVPSIAHATPPYWPPAGAAC